MADSSYFERGITSLLLAALSAVLWYLLLDTRNELSQLRITVSTNSNRITSAEAKLENTIEDVRELKSKR